MKSSLACATSLVLAFIVGTSLSAKGLTTKITISGPNLPAPIEITDANILEPFQVWSGAGTFHGHPGTRTEETEGFIIDWTSGTVLERPSGLPQYQISFYVTDDRDPTRPAQLAYVVLYAIDSMAARDVVYLPGKGDRWYELNVWNISRRREGNWFRATEGWQKVARPLILRESHR
jgi:hypothetical protein